MHLYGTLDPTGTITTISDQNLIIGLKLIYCWVSFVSQV